MITYVVCNALVHVNGKGRVVGILDIDRSPARDLSLRSKLEPEHINSTEIRLRMSTFEGWTCIRCNTNLGEYAGNYP